MIIYIDTDRIVNTTRNQLLPDFPIVLQARPTSLLNASMAIDSRPIFNTTYILHHFYMVNYILGSSTSSCPY